MPMVAMGMAARIGYGSGQAITKRASILDRKTARVSRARIERIAREEGSAGEAALAGLLFLVRTLKDEELLNAAEVDALFAVMTAKLPEARHDEVREILKPN